MSTEQENTDRNNAAATLESLAQAVRAGQFSKVSFTWNKGAKAPIQLDTVNTTPLPVRRASYLTRNGVLI